MASILQRLRSALRSGGLSRKQEAELVFQRQWAAEFACSRDKVEQYWRRYRHLDRVLAETGLDASSRVLDVGCGISTVLHFLPGERHGIDPLSRHYQRLYRYPQEIQVREGSAEALPFADAHFDVVFCSNVLDHVTDPERAVAEVHRVLKPGGHFLLTVEMFDESTQRDEAHPHCLTAADIHRLTACRFRRLFEQRSPWIGLRRYARGATSSLNQELVTLLQKLDPDA